MSDLKYTARRNKLVEELRAKGITDEKVLSAVGNVPRHLFFEKTLIEYAYIDNAYPIGAGQTISQPYTVAFQSQLLQVKKGDKILEIGTGSGYQCAVLLELGAKVYSIERQEELFNATYKLLHDLKYRPTMKFGDGYKGWQGYAPFDKIIITAAPPEIPKELLNQLAVGGIIVAPIGESRIQEMVRIRKISEMEFSTEKFGNFAFVPMIKGVN